MSDKPEKENIKILYPLIKYISAIVIGIVITLMHMRCTYSNDILACDMPSFNIEVPE